MTVDYNDLDFTFYPFTSEYCQSYPIKNLLGIGFDSLIASTEVNVEGNSLVTNLAGWKVPGIAIDKQD